MIHNINSVALTAAKSPVFNSLIALLEKADSQKPGLLRVLTYHRVDEPARRPWLDTGLISATPESFEEQMRYLAAHYQAVSVRDVLDVFQSRRLEDLPPRAVLVTFDDGYYDFEEQAWPILKKYKIPATLFVPTAYPDRPEQTFWWDDLYQAIKNTTRKAPLETPAGSFTFSNDASRSLAYQRLKKYIKTLKHAEAISTVKDLCVKLDIQPAANCIMSWDTLRKLGGEGLTLGAHTRTHPLVNRISIDEAREEIVNSFYDLKREIGFALPIFAYPGGGVSNEVVNMLEQEGFALAFTTRRGINKINRMNPLLIKRINVGGRTPLSLLRAQLLSWTVHLTR